MPEIFLKLDRGTRRGRIVRATLPVVSCAICPWDPNERPMLEMTREHAEEWARKLCEALFGVRIERVKGEKAERVTADCHSA